MRCSLGTQPMREPLSLLQALNATMPNGEVLPMDARTCNRGTHTKCSAGGACGEWFGPTDCELGKCVCTDGHCNLNGRCVQGCNTDTGGTCWIFGCYASRGPASCNSDWRCQCKPGYCAVDGVCQPTGHCVEDTGGTCYIKGCDTSRGGLVQCRGGKCVCPEGHCAVNGGCGCPKQTGENCDTGADCRGAAGLARCENGKCTCTEGYCGLNGGCACQRDTGGTCHILQCRQQRGPTDCQSGHCICKPGYCAKGGFCVLKGPKLVADVVPVNKSSPSFPGPHGSVVTAVAFSGGGSRSFSLSIGALRALERLGLMSGVDAVSSVSGGTWASALYMFANGSTEELLGKHTPPSRLTMPVLRHAPAQIGAAATTGMISVISQVMSLEPDLSTVWIRCVAKAFLEPFGLDDMEAFMAASAADVERIRRQNPQLAKFRFLTPRPDRPKVFVMGGTVLAPQGYRADGSNALPLQMSPDYTGWPFHPGGHTVNYMPSELSRDPPLWKVGAGGGLVETFAFGGPAPSHPGGPGTHLELPDRPFSLAEALGISSDAVAGELQNWAGVARMVPEAVLWPIQPRFQEARRYRLGDGGLSENAGVLAMLQRGATRIAWFANTDTAIAPSKVFDFCKVDPDSSFDPRGKVTNELFDKFGFGLDSDTAGFLAHNQVFAKRDLPPLLCRLQRLKEAGKPAVYAADLTVQPNSWWGIEGGFTVTLALIYNEWCSDFVNQLPADTRSEIEAKASGEFANYPFFKTTFQESRQLTAYTPAQVNILGAQVEYFIEENLEMFRKLFTPWDAA